MTRESRLPLTPQASSPPQLHGLPKVHKVGVPLRPIISTIGSPTYSLSKVLARILTPLVGHTDSFVNNSAQFVTKIRDATLEKFD